MVCKICGTANVDGSVFCSNCGTTLQAEETQAYTAPNPEFAQTEPAPEATPVVVDPGKTFGLVSMILGIVTAALGALCACFCTCVGPLAIVTGAVGIVLAVLAVKKSKTVGLDNKKAKIGFILCAVGIVLSIFNLILGLILSASGVTADLMDELFY